MKRSDDNSWLDEALAKAIGSERSTTDFDKWKENHPQAVEMLISRAKEGPRPIGSPQKIWRTIMNARRLKLAAAAVIILAIAAASYFFPESGIARPAFAEVVQNVCGARSISFGSRQRLGTGPIVVSRMYLQDQKMRFDMLALEGDQKGLEQLKKAMQERELAALMSSVVDFESKNGIELDHFRKTFKKLDIDDRMAAEFTHKNPAEQFRSVKPEDAEFLRTESDNSRKIDVFLVKHVDFMGIKAELSGTEGERMTVWVDRSSGLPVRILLEASAHVEAKSNDWFEFYDFAWNEPINEETFNLTPPEGYTLNTGDNPPTE